MKSVAFKHHCWNVSTYFKENNENKKATFNGNSLNVEYFLYADRRGRGEKERSISTLGCYAECVMHVVCVDGNEHTFQFIN